MCNKKNKQYNKQYNKNIHNSDRYSSIKYNYKKTIINPNKNKNKHKNTYINRHINKNTYINKRGHIYNPQSINTKNYKLNNIPDDLTCLMFSYLPYYDTRRLSLVCRSWCRITTQTNKCYLSDMVYNGTNEDFCEVYRHRNTLRRIHVKWMDQLEIFLPFKLNLTSIIFEMCNFENINNFISSYTRHIKLINCNEDKPKNKQYLIPDRLLYPNLQTITV